MRQVLLNSSGAVVARVPRPVVGRGSVLVRVHYSLISVGTEIAPLRPAAASAPDATAVERGVQYATLARHYVRASLRDPRKAIDRVGRIARSQIRRFRPALPVPVAPLAAVGELSWTQASPTATFTRDGDTLTLVTDDTPAGYQIMSQAIALPAGQVPVVRVVGRVDEGAIA